MAGKGFSHEPVFVDKFKYCLGVQPQTSQPPSNSITLGNTNLFSNVTTGMYATGFNGSAQAFNPTLITNVGTLSTVPVNYQSGINNTPTFSTINGNFAVLTQTNGGMLDPQLQTNKVYLTGQGVQIQNIIVADLVGDTLDLNYGGGPFIAQSTQSFTILSASIVTVTTQTLNPPNQFATLCIELELDSNVVCFNDPLGSCSLAYFGPTQQVTNQALVSANSALLASGTDLGWATVFDQVDITGVITSDVATTSNTPNNKIYIPPTSSPVSYTHLTLPTKA